MHKTLIPKLEERADKVDIHALGEVTDMLLDSIKESDPSFYKHAESVLYEAYYGKKLTHELAEKKIHSMKPHGMKWTCEQTNQVMIEHGLNYDKADFWFVMNLMYNRYYSMFDDDLERYVDFSKMFLEDENSVEGKVYIYATKIFKECGK